MGHVCGDVPAAQNPRKQIQNIKIGVICAKIWVHVGPGAYGTILVLSCEAEKALAERNPVRLRSHWPLMPFATPGMYTIS